MNFMSKTKCLRSLTSLKTKTADFSSRTSTNNNACYVTNAKLLQELKEIDDKKCKEFMQKGLFFAFQKGKPLIQVSSANKESNPKAGMKWKMVQLDMQRLLPYFGTEESLLNHSVLLDIDRHLKATCGVSIPSGTKVALDEMDGTFMDIRVSLFLLDHEEYVVASHGSSLLHWNRNFKHCPRCGQETQRNVAGSSKLCTSCNRVHYPQVSPVAITLVTNVSFDRCLLVRQPTFFPGMYTAIAGYVEPGETLEKAVRREIAEEVGLNIIDQQYLMSQPWPLPTGTLMLSCIAIADDSSEIRLDKKELEDAKWSTKEEIVRAIENSNTDAFSKAFISSRSKMSTDGWIGESKVNNSGVKFIPPRPATANDLIKYWLKKAK